MNLTLLIKNGPESWKEAREEDITFRLIEFLTPDEMRRLIEVEKTLNELTYSTFSLKFTQNIADIGEYDPSWGSDVYKRFMKMRKEYYESEVKRERERDKRNDSL